jgi:uncharacterized protein with GYD domain
MYYVIIGTHSPETCPTANAATRKLLMDIAPDIPKIAEKAGVRITAGPYTNRDHRMVAVLESDNAESVDQFLIDSRLAHWNRVEVLPSRGMDESMTEVASAQPIF